jgi:hypothetical protein
VRRAELTHLKISDVDSQRMVVHVSERRLSATASPLDSLTSVFLPAMPIAR